MDLFYVDIKEFKKKFDKNFLSSYCEIETKSEKRFYEHTAGRYLLRYIADKIYNANDIKIIKNNEGKPLLENSNLYFSISHSKDIVIICFNNAPCGIDIEYMKKRDLLKFSEYFNRKFSNDEDFYRFWTQKEAFFKTNDNVNTCFSIKFQNDYYVSIASNNYFELPPKITDFFKIYSCNSIIS